MPNTIKIISPKKILINNIPYIKINYNLEYKSFITYNNNNYAQAQFLN